jgi:hypothetical protein
MVISDAMPPNHPKSCPWVSMSVLRAGERCKTLVEKGSVWCGAVRGLLRGYGWVCK